MQKQDIFGLSAALITPFRADGSVDLARLVRHGKHVLEQGCDSITLFGTTGEGFSIGMRERTAMIAAVLAGGIEARKLNAGVTATTVVDAVEQSRLALDFGANGLLLAPPYFFKGPDDDGLFRWFSDVLEGIGADARGVILYHIPGQTAVPLSVALVDRLKRAFPDVIAGVKDSSGDKATAEAFLAAHGELAILVGDERQLAAAMRKGAQGSICGLANIAPKLLRDVIHGATDNPLIVPLVDLIVSYPVMPAVKTLVAHIHGDDEFARMRAPLVDLPQTDRFALVRAYEAIFSARTGPEVGMSEGPAHEALKLREQAYVGYTRSLLANEIKPGQFITQRELVAITGLPLGAIRELVPRLEAEGLIRTAPHRGMQVPQVDINLVRNAFQFRLFLEEAAVRIFAKSAPAELIAAIRQRHEAILARHNTGDDAGLMEEAEATDLMLHEAVIDHLNNEIVSNAYRVNWIKIKLIRLAETRLYVTMIPQVMGEHLKIIEAIERRDEDAAALAMADHIGVARQRAVNI